MNVGILLAAGIGRRFNETMHLSNKCFMKIEEVTFLENTLSQLSDVVDEIIVVTGHENLKIVEAINDLEIKVPVIIVHNDQYTTTNNVTSMQKALDYIVDNDIEISSMFYAESDIYYTPEAKVFEKLRNNPNDNVRGSIWSPKGQPEWRIETVDPNDQVIYNYIDDDEAGQCVIGASKYCKEFVEDLIREVDQVVIDNDQTYWDEAERRLLIIHDVYPEFLLTNELIEIDNKKDFELAQSLGYNVKI